MSESFPYLVQSEIFRNLPLPNRIAYARTNSEIYQNMDPISFEDCCIDITVEEFLNLVKGSDWDDPPHFYPNVVDVKMKNDYVQYIVNTDIRSAVMEVGYRRNDPNIIKLRDFEQLEDYTRKNFAELHPYLILYNLDAIVQILQARKSCQHISNYVERCLKRLLKQAILDLKYLYPDWIVKLLKSNGTDNIYDALDQYERRNQHLILIQNGITLLNFLYPDNETIIDIIDSIPALI